MWLVLRIAPFAVLGLIVFNILNGVVDSVQDSSQAFSARLAQVDEAAQ